MYYHVSSKFLTVLDDEGAPLKITSKKALSALGVQPEKAKAKQNFVLFDNYDDALEYAEHSVEEDSKDHFVIYEVEVINEKLLKKTKEELLDADEKEVEKELDALETPAKNVRILTARLDHVHEDFDEIVINKPTAKKDAKSGSKDTSKKSGDKSSEKSSEKKSGDKNGDDAQAPSLFARLTSSLKGMVIPGATVVGVGSAFHFSGAYPLVATALAKAGLVLPAVGAAGLAAQAGVAAVIGLAAYGAGVATWYAGASLVNSVRNAYTNYMKTKKERYEDEVKAKTAEVETLEKDLGLAEDSDIVVKLNEILNKGATPKFDDKGELAKEGQPKKQTKASLLQWEIDKLKAYQASANDEDKRKEVIKDINNGPKIRLS